MLENMKGMYLQAVGFSGFDGDRLKTRIRKVSILVMPSALRVWPAAHR